MPDLTPATGPWAAYWAALPPGHFLFPAEGREVARNLAAVGPLAGLRVLDYGSGYGLVARELAPRVRSVAVWEPVAAVREVAAGHLRGCPNVVPFDPASDPGPFDLILVNSVVQYLTPAELDGLIGRAGGWLAPGGRLVLSDLIPPGRPVAADLVSLGWFSLRRGYLGAAVRRAWAARGAHATAGRAAALYRPAADELARLAARAGLRLTWLPFNLTHFRGRRTAVLSRPEPGP
jgi:SAM-dependent methyltransferase